jgi:1-acyl-sn-glycerol-3-phosphate acyltransferase
VSFFLPRPARLEERAKPALPGRSRILEAWFSRYAAAYLRRHFHALRLSGDPPPGLDGRPLLVVLNHPSWWDPLTCLVLSRLLPGRDLHAPMEARALERYRFLARVGAFPVETGTLRGARSFIETGVRILSRPRTSIWITAQGRFTDARERPARILSGAARLVRRVPGAAVLPLALEYGFWTERTPEALARFGEPLEGDALRGSPRRISRAIEAALERTQDLLAAEARRRDPEAFRILLRGSSGIGGPYDWWRRLAAWSRGKRFDPEHGEARPGRSEA